jgi:hypothetical protein
VFVRCKHPKFSELFLKSQVIMDDTISEDHPDTFDETEDDVTSVTCSFLYKTWIFCGNDVVSSEDNYVKHTISCGLSCDGRDHYVEISNVIETEYNGFIPAIRQINFGVYPIPVLSEHIKHMKWVDKLSAEGQDERPFVDRLKWKIDESGILTGQVDNSYHYADYVSEYLSGYYDCI